MRPRLSTSEIATALSREYIKFARIDGQPLEYFWGFLPYPDRGLPFCFQIELNGDENNPPIRENTIQSVSYTLARAFAWCDENSFHFPNPDAASIRDLIKSHLILRSAVGLDRRNSIENQRALIAQAGCLIGDDYVPVDVLRSLNWPNDHPWRLAVAYDMWRLGDYGQAKTELVQALGFEPIAPDCTYE